MNLTLFRSVDDTTMALLILRLAPSCTAKTDLHRPHERLWRRDVGHKGIVGPRPNRESDASPTRRSPFNSNPLPGTNLSKAALPEFPGDWVVVAKELFEKPGSVDEVMVDAPDLTDVRHALRPRLLSRSPSSADLVARSNRAINAFCTLSFNRFDEKSHASSDLGSLASISATSFIPSCEAPKRGPLGRCSHTGSCQRRCR